MRKLQDDPQVLRQRVQELWERQARKELDIEGTDAIAEGCFRIALHQDTTFAESVHLLGVSIRLDHTNPKYPYHLARIYYQHGELDQARTWIARACQSCPTSHRIWSHVYLLQGELYTDYSRDAERQRYDLEAVARRRDSVAKSVQTALDEIDPILLDFSIPDSKAYREKQERIARKGRTVKAVEPSTGSGEAVKIRQRRRRVQPRRCRWSGIHDLILERALEAPANQRSVARLAEILQTVAEDSSARRGGYAAFAILSIQWILCGYPVATVRRIGESVAWPNGSFSREILDTVSSLYESNVDELPDLLAVALLEGRLPPLLVAAIHRRRAVSGTLGFPAASVFRNACRHYAEMRRLQAAGSAQTPEQRERSTDLAKRLNQATRRLDRPHRPVLKDVEPKKRAEPEITSVQLVRWLKDLESVATELSSIRRDLLAHLRGRIIPATKLSADSTDFVQAASDHSLTSEFVPKLTAIAESGLKQLTEITQHMGRLSRDKLPESSDALRESCDIAFKSAKSVGALHKALKKSGKGWSRSPSVQPTAPSPELSRLSDRLGAVALPQICLESGPSIAETLAVLEEASQRLLAAKAKSWDLLKSKVTPHVNAANDLAKVRADCLALREIAAALKQSAELGRKRHEELVKEVAHQSVTEGRAGLMDRLEHCERAFSEAGNVGKVSRALKRLFKKLGSTPSAVDAPAAPSAEFDRIIEKIQSAFGEADDGPSLATADPSDAGHNGSRSTETKRGGPSRPISELRALGDSLRRTRHAVRDHFEQVLAGFEVYSPQAHALTEIESIEISVLARQAETFFRMGRREEARSAWSRILSRDPLDIHARKNVALCDIPAFGSPRSLTAWGVYLEMLYFYDVVLGSPQRFSPERVVFHRAFGGCYGVDYLSRKKMANTVLEEDEEAIFEFFNNTARVRALVSHKELEFVEQQVASRSPLVRLGVTRDDDPEERASSATKIADLAKSTRTLLPNRVATAFTRLLLDEIEEASRICEVGRQILARRDPSYESCHDRHLAMLTEFAELKIRCFHMVNDTRRFPAEIRSLGFVTQLRRLDDIPLTCSTGFGRPVADSFRVTLDDLARFIEVFVEPTVVRRIMEYLMEAEEDDPHRSNRSRQYDRLINQWVSEEVLKKHLPLIDSPGQFYPKTIQGQLQELRSLSSQHEVEAMMDHLIAHLSILCDRYVGLSGIARDLAQFIQKRDRIKDAIDILRRGAKHGITEEGRTECHQHEANLRLVLANREEDFVAAIEPALELLEMDDRHLHLVENVAQAFERAAHQIGADPGVDRMCEGIDQWIQRATKALEEHVPTEEDPDPPLSKRALTEAARFRDDGVVAVQYTLMIAVFNRSTKLWNQEKQSAARSLMQEAKAHAQYVTRHGTDVEKVKTAKRVLADIAKTDSNATS